MFKSNAHQAAALGSRVNWCVRTHSLVLDPAWFPAFLVIVLRGARGTQQYLSSTIKCQAGAVVLNPDGPAGRRERAGISYSLFYQGRVGLSAKGNLHHPMGLRLHPGITWVFFKYQCVCLPRPRSSPLPRSLPRLLFLLLFKVRYTSMWC